MKSGKLGSMVRHIFFSEESPRYWVYITGIVFFGLPIAASGSTSTNINYMMFIFIAVFWGAIIGYFLSYGAVAIADIIDDLMNRRR